MRQIQYKYLVAAIYAGSLFMSLLDTTIVNVALPVLGRVLHTNTTGIEWVVTGYLLSLAVCIPVSGWAADRFGTKRVFLLALVIFTAGSLLCSLSWSIGSLVAARVVQGIGGGMLTPVGATMLYRAFRPDERARVSSILIVPAVVAPACGPIVGGFLVQALTWRAVFWVNIPIGLLALVAAGVLLREQREQSPGRFDIAGFLLASTGLASVLYALSQVGERRGVDGQVLWFGLAGLVILVAFVLLELRVTQPMLDLRLFTNPLFRIGNATQCFGSGAQFGTLFLLPLLLQAERGLSPLQSGLTTFPQAIGVMTMAPVAGQIYRHLGPRRMAMIGLLLSGVATLGFLRVDLQTDEWWIRAIMLLRGWGFALSLTSMTTATFATVRSESMGRGNAISNVSRQASISITVALLATVLSSALSAHGASLGDPGTRAQAVTAFHAAFLTSAILAFAGAALTLLVNDRLAAGTMRRADEQLGADGATLLPATGDG